MTTDEPISDATDRDWERRRGILIVIEGIDGAGKSTQVQRLARRLTAAGEDVVVSKEPTDGPWGRKIREASATERLSLEDELHAFVEDRKQHVASIIRPGLEDDKIVLLDRYYFSTIAYQGSRGADVPQLARRMERIAPRPDMVILVDIDPAVALSRIRESRGDVPNAFETGENLRKVRSVFHLLAQSDDRIWMLDGGTCDAEALHRRIVERVVWEALKRKRCSPRHGCPNPGRCVPSSESPCRWAREAAILLSPTPTDQLENPLPNGSRST